MSVSSKSAKPFVISFVSLTILLTACGSSNNPSDSNSSANSNTIESSSGASSEPSASPSLELNCSYDLKAAKQEIVDRSASVIDNWLGNIWLNSELSLAIFNAEKMAESPDCERFAKAVGLPEAITYGKKVQAIGESRVQATLDRLPKLN